MKKIAAIIMTIMFMFTAEAKCEVVFHSIYAVSDKNIETAELKPGNVVVFYTTDKYSLNKDVKLEENTELNLKIKKYIPPKRGKRDGYLKVELISYTLPNENKKTEVNNTSGTLRLSTPKDLKETAKHAGVSAAGHILKIPGFSQALAVSKGLIKPNPEESRLKSAGENLYESTPLTYTRKGEDLAIETDSIVVIRLKQKNNAD